MDSRSQSSKYSKSSKSSKSSISSQRSASTSVQKRSTPYSECLDYLNWIVLGESQIRTLIFGENSDAYEPTQNAFLFQASNFFLKELNLSSDKKYDIQYYRPLQNKAVTFDMALKAGWTATATDFRPTPSATRLFTMAQGEHVIHLAISVEDRKPKPPKIELDAVGTFKATLQCAGSNVSPCVQAKSSSYDVHQSDPTSAIHDGRGPQNHRNQSLPVRIYHPIFAKYEAALWSTAVSKRDLEITRELCFLLSRTDTGWETRRNVAIRQILTKLFGVPFQLVQNDDNTVADGAYMVRIGAVDLPVIILELKRWLGEGGCDPFIQAELIFLRYWAQQSRLDFCYQSHCPTFLLAGTGATLGVMGAVITDKVIAEHLSPIHVFLEHNLEQCSKMYLAARSLCALRECIRDVPSYWEQLASRMPINDPLQITSSHSRFFPYPTSYKEGDETIYFHYIRRLENDDTCQTFLAKTDTLKEVVVKFVSTYGVEVHNHLACADYAPKLYYHGPLPDYPSNPFRPNLPPDIPHIRMYLVVMEYIPPRPYPDHTILVSQLEDALTKLHEKGFVFGDLRPPNVLFDGERIRLIDYNWAGRYKVDEKLLGDSECVPLDVQRKINAYTSGSTFTLNATYAQYPVFMSNAISWPDGVGPRDYILPWHDWDMLARLFPIPSGV